METITRTETTHTGSDWASVSYPKALTPEAWLASKDAEGYAPAGTQTVHGITAHYYTKDVLGRKGQVIWTYRKELWIENI